jgi:chromosomal replication initiation ATPase DnaA
MRTVELVQMVSVPIKGQTILITREEAERLRNDLSVCLRVYGSSLQAIAESAAEFYRLSFREMFSKQRTERIAFPRQVAMYLSRMNTDKALTEIGEFYKKDHGTVLHAVDVISGRIQVDPKVKSDIEILTAKITAPPNMIPTPTQLAA